MNISIKYSYKHSDNILRIFVYLDKILHNMHSANLVHEHVQLSKFTNLKKERQPIWLQIAVAITWVRDQDNSETVIWPLTF